MSEPKKTGKRPNIKFDDFLKRFIETEWPVVLTEETYEEFSRQQLPIPQLLIEAFIRPFETIDEHTEFVPCIKWQVAKDVTAIVYWKAELMQYQYILATYNPAGFQLDRQIIAGTDYKREKVVRRVATIVDDNSVHILEGSENIAKGDFDPRDTDRYTLEITEKGEIIFSLMNETE